jgi:hypothetical protein
MAAMAILPLLAPAAASAAEEQRFSSMKAAMEALAADIGRTLADQGLDSIAVKTFDGPAGTSASLRIAQALTEQIQAKTKLRVTSAAGSWSIAGEYFAEMNPNSGKLEVFIDSTLKDQRGRSQSRLLTPIITDEQETLTMFGVSADLPTQVAQAEVAENKTLDGIRAQTVAAAIDKPQVFIREAIVKATQQSPYAIEVMIAGQPIPAEDREGTAFVQIQKEQIYAVRLINNSDEDVGVTLTIDGVNTLEFSQNPAYRQLGKWVVGARSTGIVTGWHIQGNESRSFQVVDFPNSAAAQVSSTKDIGTITAVFCAAFTDQPPADEPPATGRGGLATGFGPPTEQKLADVVRKFGVVRGAISVRYDKPQTELPPIEPVVAR